MAKPAAMTLLAWTRLMRAAEIAGHHCAAALRTAGLPPPEWYDVLLALERGGPQRPRALQTALITEQYTLSRLLDRIVQAGLITRTPCTDDARGHILALTDAGKAMRAAMWPVYAEAIEAAVGARLDADGPAALAGLLGPLAEPVNG